MRIVPGSVRLKGKATYTYASVDIGSSTWFMSKNLASQLNAKEKKQITLNALEKIGFQKFDLNCQLFLQSDIFQCKNCNTNQNLVKWSHCPR